MSQQNVSAKKLNSKQSSLRKQIAFYFKDTESKLGLGLDLAILGLILLSSFIFVAQTYPIGKQLKNSLEVIDFLILIAFTIEYILRVWTAEKPKEYLFSFFGIIDLIAILPLFIGWSVIGFIRVFRWFRILRIIRFWKIEKRILGFKTEDSIVFCQNILNSVYPYICLCRTYLSGRTSNK